MIYKQDIPTNVTHTYRSSQGATNGFWENFFQEGVKISKLKSVEALFIANHRIYCEFAGQFLTGGKNYLNGGIHFAT